MAKGNPSFLNGVPELVVLELLSRGEMYGYELVGAIHERSKTALSFGEGCIYPYLHYLEKEKLVDSERRDIEGRSRNYYQITARGRKRLEELSTEWKRVAEGISLVMGGKYA